MKHRRNGLVLITDYIDDISIEVANINRLGVVDWTGKYDPREVLALLVWHQQVDESFLRQFPNAQLVVRYGVGFDNIDLDCLKNRGIKFANNPDYGVDEVSDTALAMCLFHSRRLAYYWLNKEQMLTNWQEFKAPNVKRTSKMNVLIIGLGRIGHASGRKMKALNYNISFFDPYKPAGYEKISGFNRVEKLSDGLPTADLVSLHCPLNNETKGFVNKKFIELMKDSAALINTARGGLIEDESHLVDALDCGKLGFVGLDVLVDEKNLECSPLWQRFSAKLSHDLLINPHTAFYSEESYLEMRVKASRQVENFFATGSLPNEISLSDGI